MTIYDSAAATRWGFRDVSPRAVHDAGGAAMVVDVRDPQEYASGHIPGAKLVPCTSVATALPSWDRRAEIVVVCRSGTRSAPIAEALASGFHRVMNLAGGMLAYAQQQLPIERAPSRGRP